ncbi:hypothetical protein C8A00DRAFT_31969 [Chaetomidium leptoderma]|uniref:Uncharacterized protein n=1 Tax=Chaetomidium leptoderma TaxID=669021 RepID=A0AAN6VPZ6_9PEZI|nr:hypothetical protein C8A00DRAFT_31969 [Chaetomidium leptoderma]
MGGGAGKTAAIGGLQVIVLGSGGGPLENNVTAFLVRSLASDWARGSIVAVDAGVHLSAIKTILEQTQPTNLGQADGPSLPHTLTTGPFAGLEVPNATADANAAHIHKNLIETYLITHPHLDHIAGFVINTAGLPGPRTKKVVGLPSTITALKTHVFNNVIWPNLSDENNGAGLMTYMRLVEGGSPALGEGEEKGYLEMFGGLAVKAWGVSHGHCIERHSHRGSGSHRGGSSSTRHGSFDASSSMPSPSHNLAAHTSLPTNIGALLQQHERLQASPAARRGSVPAVDESVCVYNSSVYFIRDVVTGREILIFGDVEPDSISLSPRNRQVWKEVAPKIAAGTLAAIFIECSYDDSRSVARLFGHLAPRFVCEEMTALAEEVVAARQGRELSISTTSGDKKRKRVGDDGSQAKRKITPQPSTSREPIKSDIPISPKTLPLPTYRLRSTTAAEVESQPEEGQDQDQDMTSQLSVGSDLSLASTTAPPPPAQQQEQEQGQEQEANYPLRDALKGLKLVVIHVKDRMADGPKAGDVILEELLGHEREARLGVEYVMSSAGEHFMF